jgi:putative nucleotidyltransferase with HDIG domain
MNKREEVLKVIKDQIDNKNIIKHMLAVEVCMEALADELGAEDVEAWKLAGLAHDLDYQEGISDEEHGTRTGQILEQEGIKLPDEVLHAIAAHNWEHTGIKPKSDMDWALFTVDSLTGLIVAATLVLPSRKLADVTVENVLNRFDEPRFAAGTRRDHIKMCEDKLAIPLDEFVKINLEAIQGISEELGL